ncbi:MAG: FkbM family methyltransferase [Pseudomonadota bacterium]
MSADSIAPFGSHAPSLWVRTLLAASQNTVLGRGQARRLISRMVRKAHPGPIDTYLWGKPVRVYVGSNNNEVKALLNPSSFNRAELETLRAHLPRSGGVFVDIGANVGMVTLAISAHMSSGTVVAIEPQPAMFKRLTFSLDQSSDEAIHHVLVSAAVGPEAGHAELAVPDQPGMASFALPSESDAGTVTVPVKPLSTILLDSGVTHIDALKIDVEGYEDQALIPFFARADRSLWPRLIVMEHCHSERWQRDVEAEILKLGYETLSRDKQNVCLSKAPP